MPNILTTVSEYAAATVLALIAIAFGIQKLTKQWNSTSTESSIMHLMHTELERLAKHNATITTELTKLQLEILALNRELRNLSLENQRLHVEVAALTSEVSRLQSMLDEKGQKLRGKET